MTFVNNFQRCRSNRNSIFNIGNETSSQFSIRVKILLYTGSKRENCKNGRRAASERNMQTGANQVTQTVYCISKESFGVPYRGTKHTASSTISLIPTIDEPKHGSPFQLPTDKDKSVRMEETLKTVKEIRNQPNKCKKFGSSLV